MSGDLNHSPADIVRRVLVSLSVGVLPSDGGNWPIYTSHEPENPDNVITVYDTAGNIHGRHHVNGETQQHYGLQVRIRCNDENTGFLKGQAVLNAMDLVDKDTETISGSSYLVQAVHATTGVIPVGLESATGKRRIFTINALTALRMTS